MYILSKSSSIHYYFKRRLSRHLNFTNTDITSSTHQIRTLDVSDEFNTMKHASPLTKTQIKVIITVVIIISLIMLIIAIFRFRNACRNQETDNLQTEIIRNQASQYSEPSSRRGSVGYYTRRYSRTASIRLDDQLNISLPTERLSIPACDHSSKSAAVVVLSSSPLDRTVPTDVPHHHHVTSSCDTSNIPNQQISNTSTLSINIKPVTSKSSSAISANKCDDQTPLLTSELASTIKDSSNHTTRKYSLNALLPLIRPSNSHPFCSSLTFTTADGNDSGNANGVDLKSSRRVSLSSSIRRSSFAKQPRTFCSTVDSTKTSSPPTLPIDSDTSDQNKTQQQQQITLIEPTSSLSSYQKDFMHKIERFRFIDDSASSTTTVTSPVESIERVNTRQTCNHLITSAIEQFDDFIRTKYHQDDDDCISLIDHLNADVLTNGSYSDLDILNNNNSSSKKTVLHSQQASKPVNNKSFQPIITQQNEYRQSAAINIPHSVTSLPLSKQRNNHGDTNGYSRSMDFQSLSNKRDLNRPVTLHDTSTSSSTTTLTSIRSSTSLEFDDNTKPSGVLVDDDFLPMSSPVDEHFWDVTIKDYYKSNNHGCFPNVGSSPDVEIKRFDLEKLTTLSETSCDEDDDDDNDNSTSSFNQSEIFSVDEYKIKQLQKPLVIFKPISPIQKISGDGISDKSSSNPSISSTEQFSITSNTATATTSLDLPDDELLLEKFSLPTQTSTSSDFLGDTTSSSDHPPHIISEEDDTQDSSATDVSEGDESADNGEIDLVQEFELSQKEEQLKTNNLWTTNDRDVFIIQEDDLLSAVVTTPTLPNRTQPTSIMKMANNKSLDNPDEQPQTPNSLKPKVRFNLDPQYEREREWNKVNKLLGNSVEWTDEFEV